DEWFRNALRDFPDDDATVPAEAGIVPWRLEMNSGSRAARESTPGAAPDAQSGPGSGLISEVPSGDVGGALVSAVLGDVSRFAGHPRFDVISEAFAAHRARLALWAGEYAGTTRAREEFHAVWTSPELVEARSVLVRL